MTGSGASRSNIVPNNAIWVDAGKRVNFLRAWLNPNRACAQGFSVSRIIFPCPLSNDQVKEQLRPFERIDDNGDVNVAWRMDAISDDCILIFDAQYLRQVKRRDNWYGHSGIRKTVNGNVVLIEFEDMGQPPADLLLQLEII